MKINYFINHFFFILLRVFIKNNPNNKRNTANKTKGPYIAILISKNKFYIGFLADK